MYTTLGGFKGRVQVVLRLAYHSSPWGSTPPRSTTKDPDFCRDFLFERTASQAILWYVFLSLRPEAR